MLKHQNDKIAPNHYIARVLKIIIAMKNKEITKFYWRIYDELRRRGHTANESEEKAELIVREYL